MLSYALSMRRDETQDGMEPPMTIRLPRDLSRWVKEKGQAHPHGCSGAIRDALRTAKHAEEENKLHSEMVAVMGGKDAP